MNRLFTFLSFIVLGISANGQIYMQDGFGSTGITENYAWTTVTSDASFNWTTSDAGSPGNFYAKMSNYDGANNPVVAWLITPAIDLSSATTPMMNFDNAYNYAGDPLQVYISTDYPGTGNPGSIGTWAELTSSATWSSGSWSWTGSGDIDITSYISANTYIAFKYTGTGSNGSTWEVDDFTVQEGATVTTPVSIYDIQYTTGAPADSPYMGQVVTTYGIVIGIIQNGPDAGAYFMQDGAGAWNGIYVYDTDAVIAIGDSVEVEGTVDEFNNVTEIKNVTSYTVINSGNTLPASTSVTSLAANAEEWEGVLITVMLGECTNNTEGFGLWSINDGSGVIKGDDDIFAYHLTAVVGNWYDVTGVGHYSFGEAKILPRDIFDITLREVAGIDENNSGFAMYPNPAEDLLNLTVAPDALVEIYSITGALVYSGTNVKNIDLSGFDAGFYQVVVTLNGTRQTEKLIVR